MIVECVSYVLMFVCVVGGYHLGGLTGTGIGLALSAFLNLGFDVIYIRKKFNLK
jgi:hypothetical protein